MTHHSKYLVAFAFLALLAPCAAHAKTTDAILTPPGIPAPPLATPPKAPEKPVLPKAVESNTKELPQIDTGASVKPPAYVSKDAKDSDAAKPEQLKRPAIHEEVMKAPPAAPVADEKSHKKAPEAKAPAKDDADAKSDDAKDSTE